jgi:diacylglycerol kinase (ATP)
VRIGMIIRPRDGVAELELLRSKVAGLREQGHGVRPRVTFEAGDAWRMARWLGGSGAELIVAVGGDGTVNEVVNGALGVGWRGRFAVIPNGTANDFAVGLGIPGDVDAALEVALAGEPRRLDVGHVNGRYFMNVSTGGFGATATEEAPPESKRVLGPLAYLITGARLFAELEPSEARFTGPEGVVYEGGVTLFAVGNGRQTGGGNLLTPGAALDDGQLDVVIVPAMSRMDLLGLFPALRAGSHLDDPDVVYTRVPRLVVESKTDLSVNADGEPMGGRKFTYAVAGRRLVVMTPRDG